ncbi:MAG: hypothetical protein JWO38_1980 [Gemmataceae bacterium]|nr:hypothetical protein [Gemmataceae bacterium]
MSKGVTVALLVGAVAFVVYLAATGVTVADARNWVERQTGVRARAPELKSVPHPAYAPVVVPGR